jgi:NAD(P)-dependent dehydrogenase (short-subunit alcohol dehydrogenase family)
LTVLNGMQIAIIGATNGIGLAAAEAFAARGANVAIVGRNETRTKIATARDGLVFVKTVMSPSGGSLGQLSAFAHQC